MDDLGPLHHYMGIELNQQTWALLGKKERNDRDNQRMIAFAKSSLFHWEHSPNFQPVNAQRGLWLISRVYSVLGEGEKALSHANECWTLTEELGLKDFDLAYAFEAFSRAYAALGEPEKMNHYFIKAKQAGDEVANEDDKKYFMADLHAGPWFECIKPLDE